MSVEKIEESTKKKVSLEGVPPKVVKVAEELSCELNDVEWQNRARELAQAHKETEQQKERKKSVMAELGIETRHEEV
jgi:hypothetical protein